MENLQASEFKKRIQEDENAVVIDVRSPQEEVEGLIENSININIMDPSFAEKVKALDKNKNYYVYCRAGGRSASACGFMEQQGLTAYNLAPGIIAWNQL
jgi:rhodanese-related sulfurtransferase